MVKEKKIKEKLIAVKVDEAFLEELDAYASKLNMSRSQLMRNLMNSGMEDLKVLHHTGALMLITKGADIFKVFRDALRDKNYRIEDNDKLVIDLK